MARTRHFSLQTARTLASSMRTTHHIGRAWSVNTDRDFDAQTQELMTLSQAGRQPR